MKPCRCRDLTKPSSPSKANTVETTTAFALHTTTTVRRKSPEIQTADSKMYRGSTYQPSIYIFPREPETMIQLRNADEDDGGFRLGIGMCECLLTFTAALRSTGGASIAGVNSSKENGILAHALIILGWLPCVARRLCNTK